MTIIDIAQMAGVSTGTVSRVVNERDGVGQETRERVLALIAEQGYQASFFAKNLATKQAYAIGVVFPVLPSELVMHPVFPELLGAVGDVVGEADYSLMLLSVPADYRNGRVLAEVTRGRLDGLILTDVRVGDDLLDQLVERRFPAVVVGHRDDRVLWVDCDHDQAVFELTAQLIGSGHKQIAFVNGPLDLSVCILRRDGYRRALEKHGLAHRIELERQGPFTARHGFESLQDLLNAPAAVRPTAVVAASDVIAAGCLDAARVRRLRVPHDIAVTGFDDQPLAAHVQPSLTTARMPIGEMGRNAAEMLLRLIEGEEVRPRSLVLPSELVVRESSGARARWIF
ncbi:LacI family DNA-binding transcriptional regulator [Mesorhizobium sp. NPDC059054]|uniref:LacI family DNA-binding transcriptional regulator n=1 Tax=unclassified Mesorhizobium TaxID=325217 RepID=UPI0036C0B65C